jgi:high-affinity nickel permease
MTPSVVAIVLGLSLGVRHAFEPDHLAAVSVLNAERPEVRRGLALGALWGVGHSLALFAATLGLSLFSFEMPPRLSTLMELAVALMLIVLGTRACLRVLTYSKHIKNAPPTTPRRGFARFLDAHFHFGGLKINAQPLVVGALHGLAGSGALTAFMLATLPSTETRVTFLLLFALGSIVGMSAMSGGLGFPLRRLGRDPRGARWVLAGAGLTSVVCGIWWGWPLL